MFNTPSERQKIDIEKELKVKEIKIQNEDYIRDKFKEN